MYGRLQTVHFIRHGQGFHNVFGEVDAEAYKSGKYEDAHLTELGWQQVDNQSTEHSPVVWRALLVSYRSLVTHELYNCSRRAGNITLLLTCTFLKHRCKQSFRGWLTAKSCLCFRRLTHLDGICAACLGHFSQSSSLCHLCGGL